MSNKRNRKKSPEDTDYEVGFGKPPKRTQWKKGQSGNPKGKPKGSKNASTVFEEMLAQTVVVKVNGQEQRMPLTEALRHKLTKGALQGTTKETMDVMKELEKHFPGTFSPKDAAPDTIRVLFVESDGDGAPEPGQGMLPWEGPVPENVSRAELWAWKSECYAEASRRIAESGEEGYFQCLNDAADEAETKTVKEEDNDDDDSWLD